MIILKVSVCAQAQSEIIANMFTGDLNHFLIILEHTWSLFSLLEEWFLLERSHVAGGEDEYMAIKTGRLLWLSRDLSVMPELCHYCFLLGGIQYTSKEKKSSALCDLQESTTSHDVT